MERSELGSRRYGSWTTILKSLRKLHRGGMSYEHVTDEALAFRIISWLGTPEVEHSTTRTAEKSPTLGRQASTVTATSAPGAKSTYGRSHDHIILTTTNTPTPPLNIPTCGTTYETFTMMSYVCIN